MLETVEIIVKTRGLEFGNTYDSGYDIVDTLVDVENTLKFLESQERLSIAGEKATGSGD